MDNFYSENSNTADFNSALSLGQILSITGDNLYPLDFNTISVDDKAAQSGPTTEMEGFTNLSTLLDYHNINQVSKQHVSMLTLTDSAVLQNDLHPWPMPAPYIFPFLHLPQSFILTRYRFKALLDESSAVFQSQSVDDINWMGIIPHAICLVATVATHYFIKVARTTRGLSWR